jgi:phage gp29-like protein
MLKFLTPHSARRTPVSPPMRSYGTLGLPLPPRRKPAPAPPLAAAGAGSLNPDLQRILRREASGNWMLPALAAVTPQYIEGILRGALGGDPLQQWNLFDLMEDTWPRLLKDLNELKGAVVGMDWKLEAWAEEDQPPTADAIERKKVISDALWKMNPASDGDDNGFEQTIFDILDAHAKGLSVLEIIWEQRRVGQLGDLTVPNSTCWVHPRNYGWSAEGYLGLNPTGRGAVIERFPENKFIVAICKAKSGSTGTTARLRALAWWWCAANFSGDWLMNLAQLFGIPFRWATFANGASADTIAAIGAMLSGMGSSGYGAFPEGTNLNFLEAGKNAGSSPQADLLERADKNCDLLILGQTLTSDTGNSGAGGGSLALGKVHAGVREQFIQEAANFAARVINQQLIPAILRENYGEADEAPYFSPEPETQKDLSATALMIKTAVDTGFKVPAKWAHAELSIPLPQAGEEIIEKAAPPAPPPGSAGIPPAPEDPAAPADLAAANRPAPNSAPRDPQSLFTSALSADLQPVAARLQRILTIQDAEIFRSRLSAFLADMDQLKRDIVADPACARALEQIIAAAAAAQLRNFRKPTP